ncbi:MAG: chloride channel protein, partial [Bdellovibrionales bacterium]|nr:chloride channel protein [Bdellovibrionales bacterium]
MNFSKRGFAAWARLVQRRFVTWMNRRSPGGSVVLLVTAIVVGLGTGIAATFFRELIEFISRLSFGESSLSSPLSPIILIGVPTFGGVLVGVLTYFFASEAKGHGVPEVMEAVALRGGRIRPRVAVVKALASSLSIGTGGSVGREGPIVQIGASL